MVLKIREVPAVLNSESIFHSSGLSYYELVHSPIDIFGIGKNEKLMIPLPTRTFYAMADSRFYRLFENIEGYGDTNLGYLEKRNKYIANSMLYNFAVDRALDFNRGISMQAMIEEIIDETGRRIQKFEIHMINHEIIGFKLKIVTNRFNPHSVH